MTVCSLDFAFLSARFSLSDFPDLFDMDLRGDLSDIIGPSIGNLNGPDAATVRHIQLVPRIVDQHFMTIGGEVPTQAFAITRLLLAFLHRAVEGLVDQDDWEQLWATGQVCLTNRFISSDVRWTATPFDRRAGAARHQRIRVIAAAAVRIYDSSPLVSTRVLAEWVAVRPCPVSGGVLLERVLRARSVRVWCKRG
jgi:CRISPR-associated protein Cse1 family